MTTMAGDGFVVENVRVFNGASFDEPQSVVVEGGVIVDGPRGEAEVVDGEGMYLIPGLIDCHVHLDGPQNLIDMAKYGVTTACEMGTFPFSLLSSLRGRKGSTDILSCGIFATSPGSPHSHLPSIPADALVCSPPEAEEFVRKRACHGADYIKVVADAPGPSQTVLDAIVSSSHKHRKLVVVHAVSTESFTMAQNAKADIITHVPIDSLLQANQVSQMVADKTISIPTLAILEVFVAKNRTLGLEYKWARKAVNEFYSKGVPILAGTDSNATPGSPASMPHGESIHSELEALVEAGLSTADALRSATCLPARVFGLENRGAIKSGYRADLILLGENPLVDIRATRSIQRVWIEGIAASP